MGQQQQEQQPHREEREREKKTKNERRRKKDLLTSFREMERVAKTSQDLEVALMDSFIPLSLSLSLCVCLFHTSIRNGWLLPMHRLSFLSGMSVYRQLTIESAILSKVKRRETTRCPSFLSICPFPSFFLSPSVNTQRLPIKQILRAIKMERILGHPRRRTTKSK